MNLGVPKNGINSIVGLEGSFLFADKVQVGNNRRLSRYLTFC